MGRSSHLLLLNPAHLSITNTGTIKEYKSLRGYNIFGMPKRAFLSGLDLYLGYQNQIHIGLFP